MWHLEKIPKVLHLYWGNETISFLRYITIFSFRKFNPDWQIKFYYPTIKYQGEKTWPTVEHTVKFTGENYLERIFKMDIEKIEVDPANFGIHNNLPESYKADFVRWHLLATEGGLWSDFDIIYLQPVENLYLNNESHKNIDTVICLNEKNPYFYRHSIGFLMAGVENDLYKYICHQAKSSLDLNNYQSSGSHILNTYFYNTFMLESCFKQLRIANLKPETIYPVRDYLIPSIYKSKNLNFINEDTVGLHWFAGHPEAGRFENLLTESNFKNYDNILAQLIRKIL